VIDFIDMEERRNNRKVENRLKDALRHDRARIQVGRISHFGLLEMSRQRLRTGVLEGSTTQCPHCQGTGIIRSVESVALAVLRALEDQLLRDSRSSLTAVTTADAALYILNNKRAFVTDMERRYGVLIAVQASERMQGANFAIERSAAQAAPQRSAERAVVNMESGFDRQETEEDAREEAEDPVERGGDRDGEGGRRGRRRRRRGRRDDRGDERYANREHRGERSEHSHNGEREDAGSEPAEFGDHSEVQDDLADEAADRPAGLGEQPSVERGENGREDRPGRRRRRGRRGGRRGRDDAPREYAGPHEHSDDVAAHEGASGNGASEPEAGHVAETDHHHEERHATGVTLEPARSEPEAPRHPEPAALAESSPDREPEPITAQPAAEPLPDEPSRPARKGWWQRKFSGE
jgi:ribonuclease E